MKYLICFVFSFLFMTKSSLAENASITYIKDVAPILKQKCVECHRPGEVAPMSFESYESTRPWAKSIVKTALEKKMPPWFADPAHGNFSNKNVLSDHEIETITKWAKQGSLLGEGKHPDMLAGFSNGWQIGTPDFIVEMPVEYSIPAEGTVEYQYFRTPTGFEKDMWLQAAEARPGNRKVVHHIISTTVVPGEKRGFGRSGGNMLAGFAPGLRPYDFSNLNQDIGIFVPAGADVIFQMHYTSNGEAATDRSMVGMIFRDTPPKFKAQIDAIPQVTFRIPPNEPNHHVISSRKFFKDTQLIALMPHMHLRGKSFKYTWEKQDGTKQILLYVPRYDFNWQLHYDFENPILIKRGDKIICEAVFDNSSNNPYNPDPTVEVRWGDQSWEEMMIGWFTKIEINEK